MKPEMSQAVGRIKNVLNLDIDSPQMEELMKAARNTDTEKDLPNWAQAALNYARTLE